MFQTPRSSEQRFRHFSLEFAFDSFLIAQEAARHSPSTVIWYRQRLGRFLQFLDEECGIDYSDDITPSA